MHKSRALAGWELIPGGNYDLVLYNTLLVVRKERQAFFKP